MATAVTPAEIALTPPDTAVAVREAAWEAAKRYAGKSRAENTWRGYKSAWARFESWCLAADLSALPATPQTVAIFIAAEADKGLANATLEHLGAGHASPHNTLAVLEVMKGVRRERRDRPRFRRKPAEPAIDTEVQAMVGYPGDRITEGSA